MMRWMCIFTVFSERLSLTAINLFGRPCSSAASTCCSRGVRSIIVLCGTIFAEPLPSWTSSGASVHAAIALRLEGSFCLIIGSGR